MYPMRKKEIGRENPQLDPEPGKAMQTRILRTNIGEGGASCISLAPVKPHVDSAFAVDSTSTLGRVIADRKMSQECRLLSACAANPGQFSAPTTRLSPS